MKKRVNSLLNGLARKQEVERIVDICFGFQLIKYRCGQDAKRLERDLLRLPDKTLRTIFISALIADRSASHGAGRFVVNVEMVKGVLRKYEGERKPLDPKKRRTTSPLLGNHGEARQAIETAQAFQRATEKVRPARFAGDPAAK